MNKFKYYLVAIAFFLAFFTGCNKEKDMAIVPSSFTKRVLFEEFSGEWCASCVSGAQEFLKIIEKNPENIIGVSIHSDDPLEIEYPNIAPFLISEFNIVYFPFELIDRVPNESSTEVFVDQRFKVKYNAGLKIESKIIENDLEINVNYASNSDFNNVLLTVYLIEDNVPESSPGAQAGGGGNYIHQKVLRKVLSSKIGDPVELKEGIKYEKKYLSNISGYKIQDLSVIAFLHFGSTNSYEVLNVNQVKAGQNSEW